MYFILYVALGLLIAWAITSVLPRILCVWLTVTALFLGIVLPICVWGYGSLFVSGDPSGYGMFGTICMAVFAPAAIMLALFTFFKSA